MSDHKDHEEQKDQTEQDDGATSERPKWRRPTVARLDAKRSTLSGPYAGFFEFAKTKPGS